MIPLARLRHLLRQVFVENLGLKILALFIGFSMWFFISSEQMQDRIVEVPVEIINKPAALEIANDFSKSVLVQVQTPQIGKEGLIKNIIATLDLQNAHQGENVILLSPEDFRLPASVKVVKIQPSTLTVVLEPRVVKTIPVRARYSGKPADNYLIKGVQVTPETVEISGPASHVGDVNDIATQSIDLTGRTDTVVQFVNLKTENPFINVNFKDRVRVEVVIQERGVARVVPNVPIVVRNIPGPYRLSQQAVDVVLTVPLSLKDQVTAADLEVFTDGTKCPLDGNNHPASLTAEVRNPLYQNKVRVDKVFPDSIVLRRWNKSK
jgi:hypothetical protein